MSQNRLSPPFSTPNHIHEKLRDYVKRTLLLRRVSRVLERDSSTATVTIHSTLFPMNNTDHHIRWAVTNRYFRFYEASEMTLAFAALSYSVCTSLVQFFKMHQSCETRLRNMIVQLASSCHTNQPLGTLWRTWSFSQETVSRAFAEAPTEFASSFLLASRRVRSFCQTRMCIGEDRGVGGRGGTLCALNACAAQQTTCAVTSSSGFDVKIVVPAHHIRPTTGM